MAFSSSSAAEKGLEAALSPVLVMRVSYQKTGEVILTHTVLPGDTVTVTLTHSFEHIPWNEYYTVLQDGSFLLKRIEVGPEAAHLHKHHDQEAVGEERVYSTYNSTLLFITKGNQDWNSSRSGSRS